MTAAETFAALVAACGIPPATLAALALWLLQPNPTKDQDHD
jgi:hypothetical protein